MLFSDESRDDLHGMTEIFTECMGARDDFINIIEGDIN